MASAAELIAMANAAPFTPAIDYRAQPLGSVAGEEGLAVPYNAVGDAVVHVRNWSALRPRKVLIEGISPSRGGARAVQDPKSPYYKKSVDELHRIAKDEQTDMSWYEERIAPITFGLRFDNNPIAIPFDLEEFDVKVDPTQDEIEKALVENRKLAPKYRTEKQPRWVLVPPGAWDLYMGNYERMRSRNHMERTREIEALNARGLRKYVLSEENPLGFLEFKREEVRYEIQRVDRAKIDAASIIEV